MRRFRDNIAEAHAVLARKRASNEDTGLRFI
ncbi:MAG: hypothetical protein QOH98_320 [Methylobacteriaceae bacterium]|jgi:hypothetical protein|nr:hypothetical protein [Methylobacteriaceae bacterium]